MPGPSKKLISDNGGFPTDGDFERQMKVRCLFFRRGMVTKNAWRMIAALVTLEQKEGHGTNPGDIKVILFLLIDNVNV